MKEGACAKAWSVGRQDCIWGDEGSKPVCLEGVEEKKRNTEDVDIEPRTAVDTVVKCNGWSHSCIGI